MMAALAAGDPYADAVWEDAQEYDQDWAPILNPEQDKAFHDPSKYILLEGEKGTGKGIVGLHKLVRHCYENDQAQALIMAPSQRTGGKGIGEDFTDLVLPTWRNGNFEWLNGQPGKRLDRGMGLQYTEPRLDPQTKDRIIKIRNMHGGNSEVIIISIPYDDVVDRRMRGMVPSFVYVDELTKMGGRNFFTYVVQQLGRRRGIAGPQQYVASVNPEGPSHWVYQVWHVEPEDPETGKRDPDFATYHIPIAENLHHLPPGYFEGLLKIFKDPYERRRLLNGEWVERPSGDAIFKEYFAPEIHVKGDWSKKIGLLPLPGHPIIISHDPGPKNYSAHLMQRLPIIDSPDRPVIWTAFDECNTVGKFTPYDIVIKGIAGRMKFWMNHRTVGHNYRFVHVFDEAAFTARDNRGNVDVMEVKRIFKTHGFDIRALPCPKGADTAPQRVQLIMNLLLSETMFISDALEKTKDMFRLLVSKKAKEGEYDAYTGLRPLRSPYIHPFDSLSYAPWKYFVQPGQAPTERAPQTPGVFFAGRR